MGEADDASLRLDPVDDRMCGFLVDLMTALEPERHEMASDGLLLVRHSFRIEMPLGVPVHQPAGRRSLVVLPGNELEVVGRVPDLTVPDVAEHRDDVQVVRLHHRQQLRRRQHRLGVVPSAEHATVHVRIPRKPSGRLRPCAGGSRLLCR